MKFYPAPRVIELLVGEELYTTADAAIRELLQNAEDACSLQGMVDRAYKPEIVVRFSATDGWIEIEDNGLGMNEEVLNESFAAVGAAKSDVKTLKDLLAVDQANSEQIAKFGIGILSCFGVAARIELQTKMDGSAGHAFVINDYREDFQPLEATTSTRGTRIRLFLKPESGLSAASTPEIVARIARHAPHVALWDEDQSTFLELVEDWNGSDVDGAIQLQDEDMSGYLALNPQWGVNDLLRPSIIVCNGGFLVNEAIEDLLPPEATGYIGEINLKPGTLRILMNREGFKKDDAWRALQKRLTVAYGDLIARFAKGIQSGSVPIQPTPDVPLRRCLVLSRGQPRNLLPPSVAAELDTIVPTLLSLSVPGADRPWTLREILSKVPHKSLFFVREERDNRTTQAQVGSGEANLQLTEILRSDLRVQLLQAKGETVVKCKLRRYQEVFGGKNTILDIHEADVLTAVAAAAGIEAIAIDRATLAQLELTYAPQSDALASVLSFGPKVSVAYLPQSTERVVRDYSGRFLNSAHPEVRAVLKCLPEALCDPTRLALLQAYMDIATHQFADTRNKLKELLTAQATTIDTRGGRLQREYFSAKVDDLLAYRGTAT